MEYPTQKIADVFVEDWVVIQNKEIGIKIVGGGSYEIRGSNIEKLTPTTARKLAEAHAPGSICEVTMSGGPSQSGERWRTTYRVTSKSCRKIYNDLY